MKVNIDKAYDLESIQADLRQAFPEYTVFPRGNKVVVVKKTNWVGANVLIGKPSHVRVLEGFPNMGNQMLMVLLIFLGLLPGLIVMLTVTRKQKLVRNQVAEYFQKYYNSASSVSANKDLLDN